MRSFTRVVQSTLCRRCGLSNDLIFGAPRYPAGPVALVFGGAGPDAPQPVKPPLSVSHAVILSSPTLSMVVRYDNRVTRYRASSAAAPHQVADLARLSVRSEFGVSQKNPGGTVSGFAPAAHRSLQIDSPAGTSASLKKDHQAAWQSAIPVSTSAASVIEVAARRWAMVLAAHQTGTRMGVAAVSAVETAARRRAIVLSAWQTALQAERSLTALSGAATVYVISATVGQWQVARHAPNGLSRPPAGQEAPGKYTASTALLFQCPPVAAPYVLLFGTHPCKLFVVPRITAAKVYMTTHTLIARRLPDGADVPLFDCTLSADVGSFAWQFSASGPDSLFTQLAPASAQPQQIEITLDGIVWVFLVESIKRDHTFGKRRVSIIGRSVTALIGAPWARESAFNNAVATNAQQLVDQALDLSGVALDWGITDWLVPANAWSFSGTRLAAAMAVAEAAGGYLQSHRSAPELQIRHPYPPRPDGSTGGPWNWGAGVADVELAPDAIITSAIERRDGADINAIYVSGTTQGVLARILRTGSAGDKLAALQTDALITAAEVARQRGLSVLGKSGPQFTISLELPVLTGLGQPGVLDVGQLVQINEADPWRGRIRSVSVNAAMPKARQTISIERHLIELQPEVENV